MRVWIRSSLSMSGAVVLHAVVIVAAWLCPARSGAVRLLPIAGLNPTIDIQVQESVAQESAPQESQQQASAGAALARVGAERLPTRDRRAGPGSQDEPAGAPEGTAGLLYAPPAPGGWSLSPIRQEGAPLPAATADLAIGPSLSWRLAPQLTDRKDPAVRQAEESAGGLRDALDAHDREIGLGRGGAIVSALETAANIDAAPLAGKASFEVTVSSGGKVWVGVSRVDGAWPAWNKVAGQLAAQLKGRAFRVPPGARGLRFQVDLDARVLEYDGSKAPGSTRLEASSGKVGDNGMYEKLPGVYLSGGGRICQYQVGLVPVPQQPIGIGGWCDPTKALVKPQRVVSARVVSEGRL